MAQFNVHLSHQSRIFQCFALEIIATVKKYQFFFNVFLSTKHFAATSKLDLINYLPPENIINFFAMECGM
jgi:hypothetical protein